jgi:hypothetical protein
VGGSPFYINGVLVVGREKRDLVLAERREIYPGKNPILYLPALSRSESRCRVLSFHFFAGGV